jgi:hypothetical protein
MVQPDRDLLQHVVTFTDELSSRLYQGIHMLLHFPPSRSSSLTGLHKTQRDVRHLNMRAGEQRAVR